jgi:hypothetical protein
MMRGGAAWRVRRAVGAAVIAATCGAGALVLGGCGAAGVIDPVARAATVSNAAPGERMVFSMRLSSPVLTGAILGSGSGSFDPASHTGSVDMAMNFASIPQVSQALGSSTLHLQEIVDGLVLYLKLPAAVMRLPALGGKPWVEINLAAAAGRAGVPGLSSLMNNPTSSDPSQFLRYLRAASGAVSRVGTARIDGFPTTEYRSVIRLDRVAQGFPPAQRAQVRQAVAALERVTQLRSIPVEVWVDRQHLVRRMKFGFRETVSGQPLSLAMQIDIPQYGPQQPPAIPPASQVTDLTSAGASGALPAPG